MKLSWERISLKLADTFRTSKARRTDKETIWVKLEHDGIVGWGEAVPMDTYKQTLESSETTLREIAPWIEGTSFHPLHVQSIIGQLLGRFDDQRATVAAVDAALHDWAGKNFHVSATEWLGLSPTQIPKTSFTLGILDDDEALARKVRDVQSYPILKVKLGSDHDERSLAIIRELAPDKTLRVDANAAWTVEEALQKIPRLMKFDIEFVEQPIPAGDVAGLRKIKDAGLCPILADESCVLATDVIALHGAVDGINIKLSKCGGICEALRMIHVAQACEMKIMLGCMVESSLGIAAAAALSPLADWLDLDGHLLISPDPFTGVGGAGGSLNVGNSPGLGVFPQRATREEGGPSRNTADSGVQNIFRT